MKKFIYLFLFVLLLTSVSAANKVNSDPYLAKHFTNASGVDQLIGDYSGAPHSFYIQPPANETWIIARMLVLIEDTGTFDADKYGNGITLTNGINIRTNISGVLTNLNNGDPILTSADWGELSYDIENHKFGTGNEFLLVRWTFSKSGTYIKLDGANNDKIEVVVNDDFTGLVSHHFLAQGYKEQTESDNMAIAFMIGLATLAFLLMYLIRIIDKEHQFFRLIVIFFVPLLFVLIGKLAVDMSTGGAYADIASSFYLITIWFYRVFIGYIFMYITYKLFKGMAKARIK